MCQFYSISPVSFRTTLSTDPPFYVSYVVLHPDETYTFLLHDLYRHCGVFHSHGFHSCEYLTSDCCWLRKMCKTAQMTQSVTETARDTPFFFLFVQQASCGGRVGLNRTGRAVAMAPGCKWKRCRRKRDKKRA